jgi:hypothetical protein
MPPARTRSIVVLPLKWSLFGLLGVALVALYQQPLSLRGTSTAISEWLPEVLSRRGHAASDNLAAYATLPFPCGADLGRDRYHHTVVARQTPAKAVG